MPRFARRLAAVAAICAVAYLVSCAGNSTDSNPAAGTLPDLATLDSRTVSVPAPHSLTGDQTYVASPGALPGLNNVLDLLAGASQPEWAIYQLPVAVDETGLTLEVNLKPALTDGAWIGLGDFTAMHWELSGPYGASQQLDVTDAKYISPARNIYVAVIAPNNKTAEVASILFTADGPNHPPVAAFTATPQIGAPDATADLDAGTSTDPDNNIVKYEWDLDGDATYELDGGAVPTTSTTLPNPVGSVDVGLKVTDAEGLFDEFTMTLTSTTSLPPTALFSANPQVGSPGAPVLLDASASSDPEGNLAKYEWDLDGNGSYEYDDGIDTSVSTALPDPVGNIVVGLKVTDNVGLFDTFTLTLISTEDDDPVDPLHFTDPQPPQSQIVLKVVNGFPAIGYVDADENIMYARATTTNGSQWAVPQIICAYDDVSRPRWLSMDVANGDPAVAYAVRAVDESGASIFYLQAADDSGFNWGNPQEVVTDLPPEASCDMKVVAGNPAIGYWAGETRTLEVRFIRAQDANGTSWGSSQLCASFTYAGLPGMSLLVVQGNPALSYNALNGSWHVVYQRANNQEGTSWDGPGNVLSLDNEPAFERNWLCMADGNPAIVTQPGDNPGDLEFVGNGWNPPVYIDKCVGSNLVPGNYTLGVIAGIPAVVYRSSNSLYYREATEADGSAWGPAQLLDTVSGNAQPYPALTEVLGSPGIAWRNGSAQGSQVWYTRLP